MNATLDQPTLWSRLWRGRRAVAGTPSAVRLHVSRNGAVAVDDVPVAPGALAARLAALAGRAVIVQADALTDPNLLGDVVDGCRAAGASSVGIIDHT